MLKIEIKPNENIERALKRYKRKRRAVKLMQNIRGHQFYTKKSEAQREIRKKAQYKEQYLLEQEEQY
jgi:small subunit ribosomal protein S21